MDNHHKVHYTIAAAFFGALGFLGVQLKNTAPADAVSPSYKLTASDLAAVPFGKHDFVIYASPNSGAAPGGLASAIRTAGGSAKVEGDMMPHDGVWVAPDTAEGHAIADALSKLINEPVKVSDYAPGAKAYGTPYQIGVGSPHRD